MVTISLHGIIDQIDEVLFDVIGPRGTRVCLLDVPLHKNAGDALIWAGELATFRRLGYDLVFQESINFRSNGILQHLPPDVVLLCHGGGNFGDLWPIHQKFREKIVLDFPEHRIVFLSQTIYFKLEARARESYELLSGHKNLTVLVRDRHSMSRAEEFFSTLDLRYCPDLALGNGAVEKKGLLGCEVLVLKRIDAESNLQIEIPKALDVHLEDWKLSTLSAFLWRCSVALHLSRRLLPTSSFRGLNWLFTKNLDVMRALILHAAIKQISSCHVLITDRLHAHVLAGLLGIPNVVLDNNYGKLRPIFDEYSGALASSTFAASSEDAFDKARAFLLT